MKRKSLVPIGIIAKVSYYFPNNALQTLYYSLVHTHLLYTISLWGSTYPTHLTKLKKLQNKALRIISKTPIKTRITSLYLKFKILKLDDLCHYQMVKTMYQFICDKVPYKLNDYFEYSSKVSTYITRNLSKNNLLLPRFKNSRTQRFVKYVGVKVGHSIPNLIKKLLFTKFKKSNKKFRSRAYFLPMG